MPWSYSKAHIMSDILVAVLHHNVPQSLGIDVFINCVAVLPLQMEF